MISSAKYLNIHKIYWKFFKEKLFVLILYLGIVGTDLITQGWKAIAAFAEDPGPIRSTHNSADHH